MQPDVAPKRCYVRTTTTTKMTTTALRLRSAPPNRSVSGSTSCPSTSCLTTFRCLTIYRCPLKLCGRILNGFLWIVVTFVTGTGIIFYCPPQWLLWVSPMLMDHLPSQHGTGIVSLLPSNKFEAKWYALLKDDFPLCFCTTQVKVASGSDTIN